MRVGEIVQPQNNSLFAHVVDAKVWNRNTDDFSHVDMDVLFAQLRRNLSMENAQSAMDLVVLKLKTAELHEQISPVKIKKRNYIRKPIYQKQFEALLNEFTPVRQACIMFALEMQWSIDQAIVFERKDIKVYQWDMNQRALDVVREQVPNMFKQTVFWEYVKNEVRMLIGLRHEIQQVFKMDWENLAQQYDHIKGSFAEEVSKGEALRQISPTSYNINYVK